MNVQELIAKQRAELAEDKAESVDVVLGGELVAVTVKKLLPDDWQMLVAVHPPRKGATGDANVGYDQASLPRDYPATHIEVAGQPVDDATWADLWAVLDSVHRNNVGSVIWGVNYYAAIKELRELGKAAAGQASSSPAPSGSRPVASKGGSRRKSPATTTRKAS